ncbi:hypothetical protein SAMN06264941_1005 [Methanohalophilus portucalensis FDF-1]|nr:hypothetical protein SAMN06264941_1005 [Methanohalophilus portucalensis FDF-1]
MIVFRILIMVLMVNRPYLTKGASCFFSFPNGHRSQASGLTVIFAVALTAGAALIIKRKGESVPNAETLTHL